MIDALFCDPFNICVWKLFETKTKVNNSTIESFRTLLEMPTLDSFFIFDVKYYKQKDGVAVSSPLGPTLAYVFLCHFDKRWMSDCPIDYKPISYRRYVDHTFLIFFDTIHVAKFLNYNNSKHRNITFTVEREENKRTLYSRYKNFSW